MVFDAFCLSIPKLTKSSKRSHVNKNIKRMLEGEIITMNLFCQYCGIGYSSKGGWKSHEAKCRKIITQKTRERNSGLLFIWKIFKKYLLFP